MMNILIPFLIFSFSVIGILVNPRKSLVLRILVAASSVLFLVMRLTQGDFDELLSLLFLASSTFIGIFYYLFLENERA